MFVLKQVPEDFVVEELPDREFGGGRGREAKGKYSVFLLTKRNYNTEDAVRAAAGKLGVPRKSICYAGAKDRNAVTSQYISVQGNSRNDFEMKDISLKYIGTTNEPLSLGCLKGNNFRITVRNLDETEKINPKKFFINYFDSQRFSKNNAEVGRLIVKKKYADACTILREDNSGDADALKAHLEAKPTDYIGALKKLPRKTLLMYVHAFQSLLWNKSVEEYLGGKKSQIHRAPSTSGDVPRQGLPPAGWREGEFASTGFELAADGEFTEEMPLVGFSTETVSEKEEIINSILKKENLAKRDFILRDFPELSLEGSSRRIFAEIKCLKISGYGDDELNSGKKKVVVEFFLEKGAYATMAFRDVQENS
jgi:tRNA pseudouridine13 synthase